MNRKEQVAEQLRSLLARHNLMPADIEKRTEGEGRPPVSAVTVRRILKAEARTEPEPGTLRRIAEAVGEGYTTAFAENEDATAVDVSQKGGRFFLRFVGGSAPGGMEDEIRRVIDKYEKAAAKGKKSSRR
jgi:hypothetical protein